jgi:hypothetical protein
VATGLHLKVAEGAVWSAQEKLYSIQVNFLNTLPAPHPAPLWGSAPLVGHSWLEKRETDEIEKCFEAWRRHLVKEKKSTEQTVSRQAAFLSDVNAELRSVMDEAKKNAMNHAMALELFTKEAVLENKQSSHTAKLAEAEDLLRCINKAVSHAPPALDQT